jgi:dihydroneopterin aldolase
MVTVELKDIRLHAFHGFYEGEQVEGSPYLINLEVQYAESEGAEYENINETIDYATLFSIVRQRMLVPTPLLEKVAASIIRKIKNAYPVARAISISIYKLKPPIPHFEGNVGITLCKTFDD